MEISTNLKRRRDSEDGPHLKEKEKKTIQRKPNSNPVTVTILTPDSTSDTSQTAFIDSQKHSFPIKKVKNKYHPQHNKLHPHKINHLNLTSPLHYPLFLPSHPLGYSAGPALRRELQKHMAMDE